MVWIRSYFRRERCERHEICGGQNEGTGKNGGVCRAGCCDIGRVYFFLHLGDDGGDGAYRDGTYYVDMELGGETAAVAVTVENGKIADVALSEQSDSVAVFYPLLETAVEEVSREVTKNQSLTIEVSPQNAHSSQLVLDAVAEGLEQAKR